MHIPQIDNISAGYIFAYDAKTGEVLWTHEKMVEVIRGREACPTRVTAMEREQVRDEAARVFPDRRVEALIAPEGFALRENVRVSVDPKKKILKELQDEAPSLAARFAKFNQGDASQSERSPT
jgi:hypothetical protein